MNTLLEVRNLKVYYKTEKGDIKAVDDVSFNIKEGEAVGLVGESGCGKTTIGFTLLRLLPLNAKILSGEILFENENILEKEDAELRKIRWNKISMIFQAAMNSLNPVYRVYEQIEEAIVTHYNLKKEEVKRRVEQLFELVGIDKRIMKQYPHEYSGGMKQRAIIAMALACEPRLIIADEPTTALDVILQTQILNELKKLQREKNLTILFISHDISVIAEVCDKVMIMYAGKLFEIADTIEIFKHPLHPYTIGLINSYPNIYGKLQRLKGIEGEVPNLLELPPGCHFHPRCSNKKEICEEVAPQLREVKKGHFVACHYVS